MIISKISCINSSFKTFVKLEIIAMIVILDCTFEDHLAIINMIRIAILSDTHGKLFPKIKNFLLSSDEIWHAGDIGSLEIIDELRKLKPLRAVYGNIDGIAVRQECKESLFFEVEKLRVFMIHIGGNPGKYSQDAKHVIEQEKPGLFVCGHSHILKVMYDQKHTMLYINPGAAGNYGMHNSYTAIRLKIDGKEMKDLEVLDIPRQTTLI